MCGSWGNSGCEKIGPPFRPGVPFCSFVWPRFLGEENLLKYCPLRSVRQIVVGRIAFADFDVIF